MPPAQSMSTNSAMCMRMVHVQAKQTRTSVRREALVAGVILVSEHRVVVRLAGV
eukprot:COSAG01_NODE_6206_length_3796_cov_1.330268_6_plen_54_part_00